jgi:hypothetical protein
MEVSGQFHVPAALPQGKSPWNPLDRKLDVPPSRSERGGEEKNSQPPPRIEPNSNINLHADCPGILFKKIGKHFSVMELSFHGTCEFKRQTTLETGSSI